MESDMFRAMILLFALWAVPVNAQIGVFFSYAQWHDLDEDLRIAYVAGAIDSLLIYARGENEVKTARFRYDCLRTKAATPAQMASDMRALAISQPDLRSETVQLVVLKQFERLCGPLPQ